ncbi:MAG: hypothetical protein Q8S21_06775 [Candidatus Paracaedibacteraceae bacterium]|nr:hypothetical protein [Candidatus Paracaedibacteraceae bacterium]
MKLFFAWIESTEVFLKDIHCKEDLNIFKCVISQREAETAVARLLTNFDEQLVCQINQNQKPRYAIISCHDGKDTHVLLRGRLVHIPRYANDGLLEWELNAESIDAGDQIKNVIETLQKDSDFEAGFYDSVGIADVLESRTELLCWDRTTGYLTLSDILSGKKKKEISSEIFDDSLVMKLGVTPLNSVHVSVEANWQQRYEDVINLAPLIARKFSHGIINTLTVDSLVKSWPREGDKIGPAKTRCNTGYTVVKSRLQRLPNGINGLPMTTQPLYVSDKGGEPHLKTFQHGWFKASLWVNWNYKQACREVIEFSVLNGAPSTGGGRLNLNFKITDGNRYAEKSWSSTVFRSDRGKRLLSYAEKVARAHMAGSSRQLEVEFCVPFNALYDVDLDTSVTVKHERLPGGQVTGKVVSYQLRMMADQWVVWVKLATKPTGDRLYGCEDGIEKACLETLEDSCFSIDYTKDNAPTDWHLKKISGDVPRDPELFRINDLVEHISVKGDAKDQIDALHKAQYPAVMNYKDAIRNESFHLMIQFMNLTPKSICESKWERRLPIIVF